MHNVRNRSWLVIACSLLCACGMEIGGDTANGAPYDGEVAVQRAGLGAISTIFTISAERVLAMSQGVTLMARDSSASCNPSGAHWNLRHHDLGSATTLSCSAKYRNGTVSGGGTGYLWDDAANSIVRSNNLGVTTIKGGVTSVSGSLVASAAFVYWADTLGIQRVPNGGGQTVQLLAGNWYLLALDIDADKLLFYKRINSTTFELHRMDRSGTNHETLITMSNSQAFVDFAIGPTSYYWVDNGTSTRRIDVLNKATLGYATIVSTTTGDTFRHPTPTPNGTKTYFVRRSVSGIGSITINKMEGDAIIQQTSGVLEILDMATDNNHLTWVEDAVSSKRVKRAPH